MTEEEKVLVVEERELEGIEIVNGFIRDGERIRALAEMKPAKFLPRKEAETDPTHKQIIPYVVFATLHGGNLEILSYTRTSSGGESRLHDKVSIGIGGHINDVDVDYNTAVMREVADEELNLPETVTADRLRIIGGIYDDSNEVGRVHLGVLHLCMIEPGEVVRTGDDNSLARLEWLRPDALIRANLESWSQIALDHVVDHVREHYVDTEQRD